MRSNRVARWLCGLALFAATPALMAQEGFEPSPLVKKVLENLQKQEKPNLDKAVTELEDGLKKDPHDVSAKLMIVQIIEAQGMQLAQEGSDKASPYFLKAAESLRAFYAKEPELKKNPVFKQIGEAVFYNEACELSKAKKLDAAMASLKESFATGINANLLSQVSTDKDLDNLRSRADFKAMVAELSTKAVELARTEFAEMIAENKPFPFDFQLKDLNGKTVKLSDYKGKYLIVDIWGTWCPPCRAEIPHFIELLKKYQPKGLEIVGINYEGGDDEKEDIEKIKKFNKEMGVPYTCVIGDEKTQMQVPNFQGYPTTLFLDKSGKVRMVIVGGEPLYRLEAAIEALMKADAGDAKASE